MKELSIEKVVEIRKTILSEFHIICERNNIKYSLGYGTLLGAIRHGGMIPWDDDVDVVMPREEFEKLCELYKSNNCQEKYQFVNHRNHPEIKTKIGYFIDYDTITETAYKTNNFHGVHIDVYPIDVVPNGWMQQKIFFLSRRFLHLLVRAKDIHPEVMHGKQKLIRKAVLLVCSPFNYDKALDRLHDIPKKYMKMPLTERKKACIYVEHGRDGACFPYSAITEYKDYNYDGRVFRGYKDYDTLLKTWYGDYMTPPPIKDQHGTDYKYVRFYYKDKE